MAKKRTGLRTKMFKATLYVTVDENEANEVVTVESLREYLDDALIVDMDTEGFENPIGFTAAQVDLNSLEEIVPR